MTRQESEGSSQAVQRELYVEFDVEPHDELSCHLVDETDDEIAEIRQQFIGKECHSEIQFEHGECSCSRGRECAEVLHVASELGPSCPCPVFGRFECIHEVIDVTDGRVRYGAYLPDRDRLTRLIADLKSVTKSLQLRQIKKIDEIEGDVKSGTVRLNLFEVTDKQREAAVTAVTEGYYDPEKDVSLEELADELDISKSALSRRLSALEAKLVTDAYS